MTPLPQPRTVFNQFNAFTTGNPFFTILLEVSIEGDFGALEGLGVDAISANQRFDCLRASALLIV